MNCEHHIVQGIIDEMKSFNQKHFKKCQEFRKLPRYYKEDKKLNEKLEEVTERINALNAYTIRYSNKFIGLSAFEEKTILLQNLNIILEDIKFTRKKINELSSYTSICKIYDENIVQINSLTNYLTQI